jgi:hypothetical protein
MTDSPLSLRALLKLQFGKVCAKYFGGTPPALGVPPFDRCYSSSRLVSVGDGRYIRMRRWGIAVSAFSSSLLVTLNPWAM